MAINKNVPDQQDTSQEVLDNLKSNQGIRLAGNLSKQGAKKAGKIVGNAAMKIIKSAIATLIGAISPIIFIIAIVVILVLILIAGIYWGMSEESILTDSVAQARDAEVERYSTNRVDKSNIFNTWVVPGEVGEQSASASSKAISKIQASIVECEGKKDYSRAEALRQVIGEVQSIYSVGSGVKGWHEIRVKREDKDKLFEEYKKDYFPKKMNELGEITGSGLGYNGEDMPEWDFLGRMADNEGKDQQLKDEWGDIYAPILFDSIRIATDKDNLMADEEFRKDGFNDSGFNIKPYFYYKTSKVIVTVTDEEGKTHTTVTNIHLLVEGFSIRGDKQYHYEWVTYTSKDGKTTVTYESLKDTKVLDNGKKYLTSYLEKRLELEPEEKALMVDSIFESMQGFTAKKQWMDWLLNNNISQTSMISATAIPAEFKSILQEASDITGIPVHILAAIILKESTWNPGAINSETGCFGLTQLDPASWTERAIRYGFDPVTDKWNPRAQIIIGARVLRDMMNDLPDWNSRNWPDDPGFRAALARYGGYGSDVDGAAGYINDIVNKARAYIAPAIFPVVGKGLGNITSPFGMRSSGFHGAIDIGCATGTPIVSASTGIVTASGRDPAYGNYIIIADLNYIYFYAHLSERSVEVNQQVTSGQNIGLAGDTGSYSQGSHLHFSIGVIGSDPLHNYNGTINPLIILTQTNNQ